MSTGLVAEKKSRCHEKLTDRAAEPVRVYKRFGRIGLSIDTKTRQSRGISKEMLLHAEETGAAHHWPLIKH